METPWISFPKLGLEFHLPQSLAEFSLFGMDFDIRFYGVLIAFGFLLAVLYGYTRAPKFGVDRDRMLDVVLVCTVIGVLCARLYYCAFSSGITFYLANPQKLFAIWDGGLAIYGGVLGAFLSALLMCRLRKVNTLAMFDLASLGFLIGQGIGRWGNFFNQEAYGSNTDLPWGMTGDIIQSGVNGTVADQTAAVHPTFLYESLWCLLGFVVLHLISCKCYRFKGQIFAGYLIWYGAGRAVLEGFRSDSLYIGTLRVSQMLSILLVIFGIALFFWLRARQHKRLEKEAFAALSEPMGDEEDTVEDAAAEVEEEAAEEIAEETAEEAAEEIKETAEDAQEVLPAEEEEIDDGNHS